MLTVMLWKWRFLKLGKRSIIRLSLQINNPRSIVIGSHVTIMNQSVLADLKPDIRQIPKIFIGDSCTIMYRFQCNAAESVRIGNNVLIASNVLITDSDHILEPGGIPVTINNRYISKPVIIEDNCWIGQNAVILKGVTVGHDSIVGANSVITKSIPPYSVAAGNPAKIIKTLK